MIRTRRTVRTILALTLASFTAIGLAGCGGDGDSQGKETNNADTTEALPSDSDAANSNSDGQTPTTAQTPDNSTPSTEEAAADNNGRNG